MIANLTVIRGDTWEWDIAVTLNGAVLDITGGTFIFTMKYSYNDANNSMIQSSSALGTITITSAAAGTAHIIVNSNGTSTPFPNHRIQAVYDIQFTDAAFKSHTIAMGTITVLPDVTTA